MLDAIMVIILVFVFAGMFKYLENQLKKWNLKEV